MARLQARPEVKEVLSISQVCDGKGTYPLSNANNEIPTPLFVSLERGEDEYPKRLPLFLGCKNFMLFEIENRHAV